MFPSHVGASSLPVRFIVTPCFPVMLELLGFLYASLCHHVSQSCWRFLASCMVSSCRYVSQSCRSFLASCTLHCVTMFPCHVGSSWLPVRFIFSPCFPVMLALLGFLYVYILTPCFPVILELLSFLYASLCHHVSQSCWRFLASCTLHYVTMFPSHVLASWLPVRFIVSPCFPIMLELLGFLYAFIMSLCFPVMLELLGFLYGFILTPCFPVMLDLLGFLYGFIMSLCFPVMLELLGFLYASLCHHVSQSCRSFMASCTLHCVTMFPCHVGASWLPVRFIVSPCFPIMLELLGFLYGFTVSPCFPVMLELLGFLYGFIVSPCFPVMLHLLGFLYASLCHHVSQSCRSFLASCTLHCITMFPSHVGASWLPVRFIVSPCFPVMLELLGFLYASLCHHVSQSCWNFLASCTVHSDTMIPNHVGASWLPVRFTMSPCFPVMY